jgi:hypothetical protein
MSNTCPRSLTFWENAYSISVHRLVGDDGPIAAHAVVSVLNRESNPFSSDWNACPRWFTLDNVSGEQEATLIGASGAEAFGSAFSTPVSQF